MLSLVTVEQLGYADFVNLTIEIYHDPIFGKRLNTLGLSEYEIKRRAKYFHQTSSDNRVDKQYAILWNDQPIGITGVWFDSLKGVDGEIDYLPHIEYSTRPISKLKTLDLKHCPSHPRRTVLNLQAQVIKAFGHPYAYTLVRADNPKAKAISQDAGFSYLGCSYLAGFNAYMHHFFK